MEKMNSIPPSHHTQILIKGVDPKLNVKVKTIMLLPENIVDGFPGDSVAKNLCAGAGDTGLIPDPGRSHMPQSS